MAYFRRLLGLLLHYFLLQNKKGQLDKAVPNHARHKRISSTDASTKGEL